MAIGHIGKTVVFETSDAKILNFKKMQRTVKGRWASHSRVGKKPKKQFLGPDADQLTFTITLNAEHGVKRLCLYWQSGFKDFCNKPI